MSHPKSTRMIEAIQNHARLYTVDILEIAYQFVASSIAAIEIARPNIPLT